MRKDRSWLLICLILLFLFEDPLTVIAGPLKYIDELFALFLVPLFFYRMTERNFTYTFSRIQITEFILLVLFCLMGWIGTFRYHFMPFSNVLQDNYVGVKFFMAICTGYLIFDGCDHDKTMIRIYSVMNTITIFYFTLTIINYVVPIFPTTSRYGLKAIGLFYQAYAVLVALGIFMIAIYLRLYEYYKGRVLKWILMLCVVILATLRTKAFMAIIVISFIYLFICKYRRNIGAISGFAMLSGMLLIAERQITFYFTTLRNESARSALTQKSFVIAREMFPTGSGWASFGSAFSAEPYSPVYRMYNLSHVWGISARYHSFISDTFWPMILGETGFLGCFCYILALIVLLFSIYRLSRKNAYIFASALMAFLYLVISSTSESAFVNTFAIPLAMWIGIMFAQAEDPKYE